MRSFQVCLPILALSLSSFSRAGVMELQVSGIDGVEGALWVALMETPGAFESGKPDVSRVIPIRKLPERVFIESVKPGATYALCVFHDVDGNGKLDKGVFGNPLEPYAFSNNARSRFRMPDFREAAFVIPEDPDERAIQIVELK